MIFKIKETCSCGAILEYEEKVDDAYQQYCGQRQISFQRTHEKCRLSQPEEKEEVG